MLQTSQKRNRIPKSCIIVFFATTLLAVSKYGLLTAVKIWKQCFHHHEQCCGVHYLPCHPKLPSGAKKPQDDLMVHHAKDLSTEVMDTFWCYIPMDTVSILPVVGRWLVCNKGYYAVAQQCQKFSLWEIPKLWLWILRKKLVFFSVGTWIPFLNTSLSCPKLGRNILKAKKFLIFSIWKIFLCLFIFKTVFVWMMKLSFQFEIKFSIG